MEGERIEKKILKQLRDGLIKIFLISFFLSKNYIHNEKNKNKM